MFSVFSRLAKPNDVKKQNAPSPMSSSLQKKFSRGVDYNMKILIKGDRNVGKSCLLQRLQGGPFVEEYLPTDQIQVAPIHWKYKDTDHIIKVEVWEVVDKGKVKKKGSVGLKFDNNMSSPVDTIDIPPLDATFLDVYVNTNGVIMMLDITKTWTFEYVKREISTIPTDIPIIVLGNHCDMHHHREISQYQIELFLSSVKQNRTAAVRYAETSMRNGFGLRVLHKFLNIPFLQLQKQTLLNQLAVNNQEMNDAVSELDEFEKSEVTNYEIFIEKLSSKRKIDTSSNLSNTPKIASDKSPSIVLGGGKPIIPSNVNPLSQTNFGVNQNKTTLQGTQSTHSSLSQNLKSGVPQVQIYSQNEIENVRERQEIFSQNRSITNATIQPNTQKLKDDIDNFCPGVLDHNFLDDFSPSKSYVTNETTLTNYVRSDPQEVDSDSGEEGINPLVAGIQDDLDLSDNDSKTEKVGNITSVSKNNSFVITSNLHEISDSQFISQKYNNVEDHYKNKFIDRNQMKYIDVNDNCDRKDELENNNKSEDYESRGKVYNIPNYTKSYDFDTKLNYDSVNSWHLDASARRSPEGGEGITLNIEDTKDMEESDKKAHKKSKKSSKEKSTSKEKDGRKKEKKHKDKKHKKRGSQEHLEEFLNEASSKSDLTQSAYEAIQ